MLKSVFINYLSLHKTLLDSKIHRFKTVMELYGRFKWTIEAISSALVLHADSHLLRSFIGSTMRNISSFFNLKGIILLIAILFSAAAREP